LYPRVKEISGRKYVYLVAGARIRDKVTQRTLAYLGPLSVLAFGIPESTKRKTERKVRELIDWKNLGWFKKTFSKGSSCIQAKTTQKNKRSYSRSF